jgi:hypothetical protein
MPHIAWKVEVPTDFYTGRVEPTDPQDVYSSDGNLIVPIMLLVLIVFTIISVQGLMLRSIVRRMGNANGAFEQHLYDPESLRRMGVTRHSANDVDPPPPYSASGQAVLVDQWSVSKDWLGQSSRPVMMRRLGAR